MNERDQVAAKLESWSLPGGALHERGSNASVALFRTDSSRRQVLLEVREQFLSGQSGVAHEGACALLTAGPPGAGKTTAIASLGAGYRHIDPDEVKDLLLQRALSDGTYDLLLELDLPDGRGVSPRELSGLVHAESTIVANDILEVCLSRQENVILEGTLGWFEHAEYLLGRFEDHRYQDLSIYGFDVPESIAQQRALDRWWQGRISTADPMGGRFVPNRVISDLYTKSSDRSDCTANARELFTLAKGKIPRLYLRQEDFTNGLEERRHTG